MSAPFVKDRLDAIANVATLATCILVCALVVPRFMFSSPRVASHLPLDSSAPPVESVMYSASDATVVIGVNSECVHCTASMPQYRNLIARVLQRRGRTLTIVFVSAESGDALPRYLRTHGVANVGAAKVPAGSPFVRGTPVLVVVDRTRTIRGRWLGRFNAEQIEEVLKTIQ